MVEIMYMYCPTRTKLLLYHCCISVQKNMQFVFRLCIFFLVVKSEKLLTQLSLRHLVSSCQIATEAIENIRTVASLTREQTFYKNYAQLLEGPYK